MKVGRPAKDLAGERFEKFIVTNEKHSRKDGVYWKCLCDCGNTFIAKGSDIRQGRYKSCGCYRQSKNNIAENQASLNRLYKRYRTGARTRSYDFDLDIDTFTELITSNCYYCGIEPSTTYKEGEKVYNGMMLYNGIDRVDNTKGYVIGNVVSCCKTCNVAKASMTVADFLSWIERVYKNTQLF